jgi:hypothetical protein
LAPDDETTATAIVLTTGAAPLPASAEHLKPLAESALSYMVESKAAGTHAAYARHWLIFERWCGEHGLLSLPAAPEVVAMYLASRADGGWKVATIELALSAVWDRHDEQHVPSARGDAIVKRTMKGIRRRLGRAQDSKDPLRTADLRRLLQMG